MVWNSSHSPHVYPPTPAHTVDLSTGRCWPAWCGTAATARTCTPPHLRTQWIRHSGLDTVDWSFPLAPVDRSVNNHFLSLLITFGNFLTWAAVFTPGPRPRSEIVFVTERRDPIGRQQSLIVHPATAIQGTFRDRSGNVEAIVKEHSGNIQEYSGNNQVELKRTPVGLHPNYKKPVSTKVSENIRGTFGEHSRGGFHS
jgi:hypothetical protein